MTASHVVKCARCNVPLEGPDEAHPDSFISCPSCGAGDTRENVEREVTDYATRRVSLALDEMGIKDGGDVGLISALASVAVMVGAVVYKFLSGRSTVLQFTVLFAMLGIGLIGIGMNLGLKATIAFAFLQQTGSGMTIPVLLGWGLRELPQQYRGRGMGWWGSAFFLGQFVSPLMVSVVRGVTGGLLGAFIACGAACVLIAVGNAVISRRALVQSAAAPG